jgi:hypothetical protein
MNNKNNNKNNNNKINIESNTLLDNYNNFDIKYLIISEDLFFSIKDFNIKFNIKEIKKIKIININKSKINDIIKKLKNLSDLEEIQLKFDKYTYYSN